MVRITLNLHFRRIRASRYIVLRLILEGHLSLCKKLISIAIMPLTPGIIKNFEYTHGDIRKSTSSKKVFLVGSLAFFEIFMGMLIDKNNFSLFGFYE